MWHKLSKEAAIEFAKEIVKYFVWLAIPSGIGLLGWLQHEPLFYVLVGIILSGAGIMTWVVQFDEWRTRNRVEHKLVFGNVRIHLMQVDGKIAAVRFGFDVRNTAAFPITFRVDSIQTKLNQIDGNGPVFPPSKPYQKKVFTVSPGGIGWFYDHDILLPSNFQGDAIAEIKSEVSYGKASRFDHKLDFDKNSHIHIHGPKFSGGQHWNDQ